jgi:uncharacterized OB-fold protein
MAELRPADVDLVSIDDRYPVTVPLTLEDAGFRGKGEVPQIIAIVEFDEGPRLTTTLEGIPPDEVRVGMRVGPRFDDVAKATSRSCATRRSRPDVVQVHPW